MPFNCYVSIYSTGEKSYLLQHLNWESILAINAFGMDESASKRNVSCEIKQIDTICRSYWNCLVYLGIHGLSYKYVYLKTNFYGIISRMANFAEKQQYFIKYSKALILVDMCNVNNQY